jgi:hypothetical protein
MFFGIEQSNYQNHPANQAKSGDKNPCSLRAGGWFLSPGPCLKWIHNSVLKGVRIGSVAFQTG